MSLATIRQDIRGFTPRLLEMVRDHCWNTIPDEVVYIISEIENGEGSGWQEIYERRRERDKLVLMDFETMIINLEEIYPMIHDINLYVHRVDRRRTIVDVRYYLKDETGYEIKLETPAMLHAKVCLPPYRGDGSKKFDVHWEFGGLRHQWKMFWWKREMKKRWQ